MKKPLFMRNRRGAARRSVGFSSFIVITVSTLLGFASQITSTAKAETKLAPQAAVWIDMQTIKFKNKLYFDSKIDDKHIYLKQDDTDDCADVINDIDDYNDNKAKFQIFTKDSDGDCKGADAKFDVTLTNDTKNANYIAFQWVDAYKIRRVYQNDKNYTYDKKDKIYYQNEKGGDGCIDTMKPNPMPLPTDVLSLDYAKYNTATLIVREKETSVNNKTEAFRKKSLRDNYSHYPFHDKIEYDETVKTAQDKPSCLKSKPVTVYIGSTENSHSFNSTKPTEGDPEEDDAEQAGESDSDKTTSDSCNIASTPLRWIICPVIDATRKTIEVLQGPIENALRISPISQQRDGEDSSEYAAWKVFRDLANAFLVLIFLVVIFAQVLPIEIDSYMIKKMLPRIIAATIGIQMSFFIVQMMVDISNVLGQGIPALLEAAKVPVTSYGEAGATGNILGGALLIGTGATVVGLGLIGPLLLLLLAGAIAILTMLLTLIVRQILLVLLVVLAPFAFLSAILPNTEKYFEAWYKNIIKLLLMYPIVMIILSGGAVAYNVLQAGVSADEHVKQVMIAVIPIVTFFMVPAAFKMGGGLMDAVGGAVMNKGMGLSKRSVGAAKAGSKESLKERQQRLATYGGDKSKGATRRLGARILAGGGLSAFNMGKRAKYSNAKRAEAGLEEEMKLISNQYSEDGLNGDNAGLLKHVAQKDANGQWQFKKGTSKAERIAAMRMLGDNGGIEELSSLYEGMEKDNDGKYNSKWDEDQRDVWQQGTVNSRAALAKALPYSVRPDHNRSIGKLDAEGITSLKSVAGKAAAVDSTTGLGDSHIEKGLEEIAMRANGINTETGDKYTAEELATDEVQQKITDAKNQQQKVLASMMGIGQSTDRRGRVDGENVKALYRAAKAGLLGDAKIQVPGGGDAIDAASFAETFMDGSTGQFRAVREQDM